MEKHELRSREHGQAAVLGIDLRTSGVKALVAGTDGAALGRGVAGYPVRAPASGRAESAPRTGGSPRG